MGEVEASLPKLRGSRFEEVRRKSSPQIPGYRRLEASRNNPAMLHSYLYPGGWNGGVHLGFCYGCGSWGNMVPIV